VSDQRITATQASILAAMRSGHKLRLSFGLNAHAWLQNSSRSCTSSALALERKGMIERFNIKAHGCEFRLVENRK